MIIKPDGSFSLQKGDKVPFICNCGWPIPYNENIIMVRCPRCHYMDLIDKFMRPVRLTELDDNHPSL